MPGIEVDRLVKEWSGTRAVDQVSFKTGEAEFVALLGPSGCGKSTTLRLIAGLESANSGRIMIAGKDVTESPASKRNLSMVFQSYALFPHMSVAENIVFGLSIRGVAKADQNKRLAAIAKLLSLSHLLDRKPSQLSGGQQQRVALGRALIAETPVCLLDEPLSNLDAQLRSEMRTEIRSLQRRLGLTMLFVTHDQTEAMSMADRIILMRNGKVEQSGEPHELYERPASTFVARFIGTPPMNVVELTSSFQAAEVGQNAPISSSSPVLMGIRPEDIQFSDSGLRAVVESSEYFGADSVTLCQAGDQKLLVRTPGRPKLEAGAAVHLRWAATSAHYFDAESGLRCDPPRKELRLQQA
ncbi:ABC transporter ATP-binding protein [Microvirga pudoricolor]|uniref:ABC transporter ATP-binding protein n=1 Tax=Microvirga pudoricolor TaxID=2778729 RepID=UPI0019526557|nr:ABC transporter ATP-binding protein [Microvirga pudoricolor]MBM6592995.1 ABC transporter ATP-binding protein [Microvirga pudoricolor]